MMCPRRNEVPSPHWSAEDQWRENGTCSFCGSVCPGTFMEDARAGVEITPTDKSYKAYLPENRKFYFQHLDDNQKQEFVQLLNSKQLKIGAPGHFYVLPFFIQRKTP